MSTYIPCLSLLPAITAKHILEKLIGNATLSPRVSPHCRQWGFTGEITGPSTLTFPIAFTSVPFAVLSEADANNTPKLDYADFSKSVITNTEIDIIGYDLNIHNYGPTKAWWIAIGV